MIILKNNLSKLYWSINFIINYLPLKLKSVFFCSSLQIRGLLFIKNKGIIKIGENVRINSSPFSNPIGGGIFTSFKIFKGGSLILSNGCRISNVSISSKTSIFLGNNCYLGDGVSIFDHDFHPLESHHRIGGAEFDYATKSRPINIGDNVFIGYKSVILKGVSIGSNSIIGACSVVTKSIPENEIWAGNPAKYVGVSK